MRIRSSSRRLSVARRSARGTVPGLMGGLACRCVRSGRAVVKEAVLARGIVVTVQRVPQTEGAQVGASAAAVARRAVADEARQAKAQQAADQQDKQDIHTGLPQGAAGPPSYIASIMTFPDVLVKACFLVRGESFRKR